jgi:DNA polymerase-3 subunit gamma/tau
MSLYRKYRPKVLADVIGQDHVVDTLQQATAQDRLSHAYLFAGPRGTGKTSVARILAGTMLTRGVAEEEARTQILRAAEEASLVDLIEIDAASNRGIDDIRGLIEKIQFSPIVAAAKVYIIDEAHMLTREAFNALLKTLEEPPPYAFFILATTELHKIPETIQSRCQRFGFRRVRDEDIVRHLQRVADEEHIHIDRAALRVIAHHVQGGMRDALSLLDQLRSLPTISVAEVQSRIGASGLEHVEAVVKALDEGDSTTLLELIGRLEEAAIPLEQFSRQLLETTREGLHKTIAEGQDPGDALARMTILLHAIRDLRNAPVPALVLESALLGLCGETTDTEERPRRFLRRRKKEEEKETPEAAATTPLSAAIAKEEPAAPATIIEPSVEAPEVSLMSVQEHWTQVLQAADPPAVRMSLRNGRVSAIDGSTVVVTFDSAFHRSKVAQLEASRHLEETLTKIFRKNLRLKCVLEAESRSTAPTGELVNLAEAAAEIF